MEYNESVASLLYAFYFEKNGFIFILVSQQFWLCPVHMLEIAVRLFGDRTRIKYAECSPFSHDRFSYLFILPTNAWCVSMIVHLLVSHLTLFLVTENLEVNSLHLF